MNLPQRQQTQIESLEYYIKLLGEAINRTNGTLKELKLKRRNANTLIKRITKKA